MLQVSNISFSYNHKKTIQNIDFKVEKGQNLAVIGESGCGKSTLLKLIYGLYDLEQGTIYWNENQVLGPKYHLIPGMEYMKYLAQDFDLMPFITVGENIGKYLSNIDGIYKKNRIMELLDIVEMQEFLNVKAKFLSGGQLQRVALARVLALEPEVLLLDEPFSHIDNFQKNSLRRKLFKYLKEKDITTIVASHDSTDILSFADSILVMKNGEIITQNSPKQLYDSCNDYYISSLFDDVNEIIINGTKQLVYPHQLKIVAQSDLKVTVTQSFFKGAFYLIEAKHKDQLIYFQSDKEKKDGEVVSLHFQNQ